MAQKDVGNKIPIYKLKKTDEVMKYYDDWGQENKYDKDMLDWNYTGPKETTETFIKYQKNKDDNQNVAISAVIDGQTWSVPLDSNNSHYQAIQEWVAEGNTIQEAD